MVRYVVRCAEEHRFEAWFRCEADSKRALASGEPMCPVCEKMAGAEFEPAVPPMNPTSRPAYQ